MKMYSYFLVLPPQLSIQQNDFLRDKYKVWMNPFDIFMSHYSQQIQENNFPSMPLNRS